MRTLNIMSYANNAPASPVNRVIAGFIDGLIGGVPVIGWIYYFVRDALPFLDGQSIGKKIVGIRAVTESGESLSGNWGAAVIRQAVFIIPLVGFVELYLIFTDKNGVRLGDKFAKTKVVAVAK